MPVRGKEASDRVNRQAVRIGVGTTLALLAGCTPWVQQLTPPGGRPPVPPPAPIDFAHAAELLAILAELTDNLGVPDAALRAKYGREGADAIVISTTFDGDSAPSRYLLIIDHARRHQTVVLAGTNTRYQWLLDFDTQPYAETDFGAHVHRGFNTAALIVLTDCLQRLEPDYPVSLTGYSLGGAIACLLGRYLQLAGFEVNEIITFGQPQVTDAAGRAAFAGLPVLQFVNADDPVPFFPGGDYVHFAPVVVLFNGPFFAYVAPDDPDYHRATTRPQGPLHPSLNALDHVSWRYSETLAAKVAHAVQTNYAR